MNTGEFNPLPQTKMMTQMGFPQYDHVATLYTLSGQTPGTAFPISVSFNRKNQDTVSHYLSTTGVLTSAKDTPVKSTPTQHPRAALLLAFRHLPFALH
jgi:hypothetical protein